VSSSIDGSGSRSTMTIRNNPLSQVNTPAKPAFRAGVSNWPVLNNGAPNFDQMNTEQRRAYDLDRLTRKFG
jgi:hypothetical protein